MTSAFVSNDVTTVKANAIDVDCIDDDDDHRDCLRPCLQVDNRRQLVASEINER